MGNSPHGQKKVTLRSITVALENEGLTVYLTSESTTGWLIDHLKLTAKQHSFLLLESRISEMIDYSLTIRERPLSYLSQNDYLYLVPEEEVLVSAPIHNFRPLKVIGKGGSSIVVLSRKKSTGELFAVKIVKKYNDLNENKIPQIMSERDILATASNPFIVKLQMATQTKTKAHLVMEFCPGGELFFHLQKLKKLQEDHAMFYFAEIVLALEYLHKNNVIYRDFKPENILLDIDGHIKLIDFGLSKQNIGRESVTFSFCGSPGYTSPEILSGDSHGRSVDFYGLGALLYEMLVGTPPFYDRSLSKMEWNIINSTTTFPKGLSKSCKDLLNRLLIKDPEQRLGYHRGIEEVKSHVWCRGINWKKAYDKKIHPPYLPKIRESNFDKEFLSISVSEDIFDDEDDDEGVFIEGFDFGVDEKRKKKKKVFSIIPEAFENCTDVSTKKSDVIKAEEVFQDSIVCNSVESETPVLINEIPNFATRFFNN